LFFDNEFILMLPFLISAHPEMGALIGAHRKFGRDQGMRKILPQAYG
jgi:hypothetical protein